MKEEVALARPSRFLATLNGRAQSSPPIWFMRQAGRYLPEYRATRAAAGSFLDLCFNPALAAEVTLQPIRRFDLDAAILFADILLLPLALGQDVSFAEGEGPRLDPPVRQADLDLFRSRNVHDVLSPVYETVARARSALATDKALIGFAGAPWTVATYMLGGGPLKDPAALRRAWYDQPVFVEGLIELLEVRTTDYLIAQIDAGADAVQLFDTWAGGLPQQALEAFSVQPLKRIAAAVKKARPHTPVIVFPKGAGAMLPDYARLADIDAVGIDYSVPWDWARTNITPHAVVQGGLDPMLVVAGGARMEQSARRLVEAFRGAPYVFNLGHGFTPETPPENVSRLIAIVRDEAARWER
jgi:uroporphyrinogen decarboxylase